MHENDIAREIVDAAYKVHTALGPGLLESVYEAALAHELQKRGLPVNRQVPFPVIYDSSSTVECRFWPFLRVK
ncbi:MAG: GxxExxY protein [Deltaproteobacteria bacterium]|nr:GxxExxY protein [Deltaproteobacteria bacterium]